MTKAEARIVRAAVRFDKTWENRLLSDPEVYDAAMSVVRAVRKIRKKPRKPAAAEPGETHK